MPERMLKESLEQLHAELRATDAIDDETRALLKQIAGDIRALTATPLAESAPERLTDAVNAQAVELAEEHPGLSSVLRRVIDALAAMGI